MPAYYFIQKLLKEMSLEANYKLGVVVGVGTFGKVRGNF